jgi:hypothetical protein|tara:strand:+ start:651 stop:1652 length:1002 start_codon:yes stop_codon:yes gene_type:complete
MDNFNFKQYLSEGRIHKDLNISEKKEDSKKGNKEEQKRMEGAIRDNEIHIDKLNKDKKADKKKLAKLKADEPKDVSEVQGYNDRDNEAIADKDGAESTKKISMKGRRDMSRGMEKAMGKRADSTDSKMDESALAVGAGVAAVFGGAAALDKAMDALEDGKLGEKGKAFASFLRSQGKAAAGRYSEGVEEGYGNKIEFEDDDPENMTNSEKRELEKFNSMAEDSSKLKVSELKARIKEQILAELSLSEAEEEVDVDIDVEDEVEVEAGADDIEIERKGVKAKVEVGLSPEEEIIQDSLKAAMDSANALGNDKLADQIGNTITFFTREYVVGDRS